MFAAGAREWRLSGFYPAIAAQVDLDAVVAEIARRAPAEQVCHDLVARFVAHAGAAVS